MGLESSYCSKGLSTLQRIPRDDSDAKVVTFSEIAKKSLVSTGYPRNWASRALRVDIRTGFCGFWAVCVPDIHEIGFSDGSGWISGLGKNRNPNGFLQGGAP